MTRHVRHVHMHTSLHVSEGTWYIIPTIPRTREPVEGPEGYTSIDRARQITGPGFWMGVHGSADLTQARVWMGTVKMINYKTCE